jgi:hypothetical protein
MFEDFYKQRLDFVIERSLNEIELKKLLDDMVKHDKDIKFVELESLVATIFKENATELVVMQRANTANWNQITFAQGQQVNLKSFGIVLQDFRCCQCKRILDQEIRDAKRRRELEMATRPKGTTIARRMTVATQYAFESKEAQDSDEDDTLRQQFQTFDDTRNLTIFSCGHAYHRQCLAKVAQERLREEESKKKNPKQKSANATVRVLDEQYCPQCFSDTKKVDFDVLKQ